MTSSGSMLRSRISPMRGCVLLSASHYVTPNGLLSCFYKVQIDQCVPHVADRCLHYERFWSSSKNDYFILRPWGQAGPVASAPSYSKKYKGGNWDILGSDLGNTPFSMALFIHTPRGEYACQRRPLAYESLNNVIPVQALTRDFVGFSIRTRRVVHVCVVCVQVKWEKTIF